MKLKFLKYSLVACFLLVTGYQISAQSRNAGRLLEVRVLDENKVPIEGVTVNAENVLVFTDYKGECLLKTKNAEFFEFSAPGYGTKKISLKDLKQNNTIVLSEIDQYGVQGQLVDNGFYKSTQEETLASVSTLNVAEGIRYSNHGNIADYINGMLGGMMVGNNVRGLGAPLYVVDGVPGRDINHIDAREVEDVTFLRDANAVALWGSKGANGVVYIKTKRGVEQKNEVTVTADYGMFIPKSLPEYLDAAEYMTLNNEAQINDGHTPKYSQDVIDATASGYNPYKYADVDFYSKEYVRPIQSRANAMLEFKGGNKGLKYYVNLKYGYTGTLEKVNPSVDKGAHDFSVRTNLDMNINKWIKSSVDVNLVVGQNRNAFSNLFNSSSNFRTNLYAPLIPVELLSEDLRNSDLMKSVKLYNGYILAGSSAYKDIKPFASIFGQGYTKAVDRLTQVANTIDFDLGMITKGLYARTTFGLDYYDKYAVKLENKFNYYEPVWDGDVVVDLLPLGVADSKAVEETVGMRDFLLRLGGTVQVGYNRTFNDQHTVNAMLLGYTYSDKIRDVKQAFVDTHMGFDLAYNYGNRYFIDFTGAVMNSPKLAPRHRACFSPSLSLGWVLSNEKFMENASSVDFMKLRASYADIASDTDIDKYYLYQDVINIHGDQFSWADGAMYSKKSVYVNGANYFLQPIRNKEFTVGLDASFLKSLSFSANWFLVDRSNFVKKDDFNYPNFYQNFTPYYNNGVNRYQGVELSLNYGKKFGDFTIDAGLNFVYAQGIVKSRDELELEYDYLSTIGDKMGTIRGLVADNFYQQTDFNADGSLVEGLPQPSFGKVQAGDIKYLDQNGDGIIDNLDERAIGCTHQPYSLAINLFMKYKDFSLFIQGRGAFGGDALLNHSSYYWVDGNDKYSAIVRNRWTPETAETATYPRLSADANLHDFRNSSFWLYDKSFFDLSKVQLTYSLPTKVCNKIGFNSMDFNITGTNLLKIAKERKILELGIPNPQFRGVMFGVRFGL